MERNKKQNQNPDSEIEKKKGNEHSVHVHMDTTDLDSLMEKVKLILILLYEVNKISDLNKAKTEE